MAKERERRRTAMRRGEMRTARRERQESKKKRRRILYFLGSGTFAVAIIVGLFIPSFPGAGGDTGRGASGYEDGIGGERTARGMRAAGAAATMVMAVPGLPLSQE